MSEANSTAPADDSKPATSGKIAKPRPDFPLTPHRAGYWCKKVRGVLHYFGPRWTPGDGAAALAAADAALEDYNRQADALHSGRKPRPDPNALTVKDAVNAFLTLKLDRQEEGRLSPQTFGKYKRVADELISHMSKTRLVADLDPEDFAALHRKMAKKWGPYRLADAIQIVRSVFKQALDDGLIDRPVRFGRGFDRPSKNVLRKHRAGQGPKLFTAEEVHQILAAAGPTMKAMVLLGINCGFGNADCGNLPISALDLDGALIDYPRPKTGVNRRCPLWPETVAALRAVLAKRPEPKNTEHAGFVFLTKYGLPWAKATLGTPITQEMRKLLNALGLNGNRNFYALRHTFRTVADESKDQVACDHIMGHEVASMASVYRERISDERLKAVSDHVRSWLFGGK